MGLMDSLKDEARNQAGIQNENLAQSVLSTFQSQGGLSGLVTTFHEKGMEASSRLGSVPVLTNL